MTSLPRYDPPAGWEPGAPFWAAVERGCVALPRCPVCGNWVWYPDESGEHCPKARLQWHDLAGTGRVYSLTRVHRSFLPNGRDQDPYLVGLVDLDDVAGARLVANLDDVAGMVIGARVRLRTERLGVRAHPIFELA